MSDFPKHLYKHPGPYGLAHKSYAVLGVADAEEEDAGLAKGWSLTMEEAWELGAEKAKAEKEAAAAPAPKAAAKTNPPDQDGDGKPGGSKKQDDISDLRAEYEKAHGKKPFNGWDADTLKAKIAEASK